ncbi:MAG: hypothetical protein M0P69_08010 [Bacteroidales bacterium]|jgi:hemerythrin-like metal-binding protein|nr:hypothetical protein [Bacteroidales bacterium]MDD2570625.1 hypothetical protein [Bacteroidales bacterium]MDD2813035.1 hypothetical protein [Bacteroidales bacterium]MDD3384677.1 hypothetical protein [Bacteroidales bacterium]MDD3810770.1 hypothetical protein [Bacteroidales bacterium]
MKKIRWSKKYSIGLVYLDNHRRNYIDIMNELVDVLNQGSCAKKLPLVFHRLAFYIEDYFIKKEMAIQDAPHLLFKEYKKEHQRFTDGISRFEERFRAGETDLCLEMFEFMQTWIENYIKVFGTEAAEYMRSKGYE